MSADAVRILAGLRLDDGRPWGDAAQPWQWADAKAVLDPAPGEARNHFLTRARGGSKTTDLAGMSLSALVSDLPTASRAYAVAVSRDQGRLLLEALRGFVMRNPTMQGLVQVDAYRARSLTTGSTLDVLAADGPSAWGLLPSWMVVDEIAQWGSTPNARQMWEAILSAVPKVPGCRLVCLTTAGDPAHWSGRVREHARRSKAWRLHEVPGPLPWSNPAALAEQRALLTESQFARLHLNTWTAPEDRLTTIDDLRACIAHHGDLDPASGVRYVLGADVGIRNDRTVVAVCHSYKDDAGRLVVVLDRMAVWSGTRANPVRLQDVEDWVVQAVRAYNGARVRIDPWQAVGLAQRLRTRGAVVAEVPFSSQSVGRLAFALYDLVRDHRLRLPGDEALIDELANVRLRETSPGVLRLDHDAGRHDDRAIALALAASHLADQTDQGAAFVEAWRRMAEARPPVTTHSDRARRPGVAHHRLDLPPRNLPV